MKLVYCSNCGQPLEIKRKALVKYSMIIDMVPPHNCSEEPKSLEELGVKLNPISVDRTGNKFDEKLSDLNRKAPIANIEPGDRRPKDQIKDTTIAPQGILDAVRQNKEIAIPSEGNEIPTDSME